MIDRNIDEGKPFDWGRTSLDYAKYRDIYPQLFYDKIVEHKWCVTGQNVLDLGTGTGVLPRNMARYGAKWTGIDLSENQIQQAKILSEGMDIKYETVGAEDIQFPDHSFDLITACQCFWYFDHKRLIPALLRMLKPQGRLLVLYMAWLPFADEIAGASEELVLQYNPKWSGRGETMHPIEIPDCYWEQFELEYREEYPVKVHFTRESWNGRMKACRGIGASLSKEEISKWEKEHIELLKRIAPVEFDILHYGAIACLRKRR